MWKAAFTGRSEGGGSSAGRPSEPKRKRSHRAESVTSSRPRDDDDRRRNSRAGSVYDGGEESVYGVPSSGAVGYGSSPSHMAHTAPLTASALRMLPDDEEEWEDEDRDARSERKSRRSEGEKRRRSGGNQRERDSGKERERDSGKERERERDERKERDKGKDKDRSRSDSRDKERRKVASKASEGSKKSSGKEKDRARDSQSERERDSKRRPQVVESPQRENSRAIPEMGSFEQFPGQYAGGHMGPSPSHHQEATMSGALPNSAPQQGQFPGQDPYQDPSSSRPALEHASHSFGAAADYYLDAGESVQHQPGVRINSPNMLVNPDQHLIAASAQPIPAMDTGNGTANDFYSGNAHGAGANASAPVTPASKPKPKPSKQSSWSAFKPGKTSKPGKVGKPSKTSSTNTAAAAMAAAAGVGVLSSASHSHSSSSQQQYSSSSKPGRRDSDGNVYYGPPPHSQSPSYTYGVPGSSPAHQSVNAHGAQSTNGGSSSTYYTNDYATAYSTPGKQSTDSNSNVPLYAAGAAAAGLAAYGINQHQQQSSHNFTASGSYGGGGGGQPPRPGMGGFSHYPSSGGGGTGMHQIHHQHEHKGPMTRLKDGLFNLISTPEDTAKMEMYTEYIGVCKHCFDPRTSPGDAPRQHHYHKSNRRDSFEELRRRRSNEKLGRKGSNDSLRRAGSVRVDKDNRYYASDSSRKRRESGKGTGILGAGLAAAGVATAANAIFGDSRKDFDDTYSVKSGHRERSAARRRSRSSSREQRRKSTYGVVRPSDREEFVSVRRKDGTVERRRVQRRSRSSSREGRSNGFFGAAAGAAVGAGAASAGMRRRSRSRSRDSKGRKSGRRSPRSSYGRDDEPSSGGIFGGFFSPPKKSKTSRNNHHKKPKGFFTFSNSSSSSSNSELAFGDGFSSKTSLPLRRKSSGRSSTKRSRRSSDDHLAATVAGIGATAAALAAAQKGGRISKRSSKVELGARKDVGRHGRANRHGSSGSSDDEWEDELPSDASDGSSIDGGLAFGDYGSRRVSSRQSLESMNSQSSAGGLGAWGWRWGGKDKKRQSRNSTSPRPAYAASTSDAYFAPGGTGSGYAADISRPYPAGPSDYLDDTGRRLPSMTSTSSPAGPTQPLQVVDPQPMFDANTSGQRHHSIPGAFGPDSPPIYRPGPAPLQQPQPTTPIKAAFTQSTSGLEDPSWARNTPSTSTNFVQDAALIGAGALATAGIIAASTTNNSSSKKSRDSVGSNVRFGLTEDQQRKEDRERRKEEKQADEDRRRADRTRALKEEAERATRESESRKAEAEARERRQEEIRRAREDENRRAAEAKLAAARREAEEQAQIDRERQAEQQRSLREREEVYRREQVRLAEEARQQEEQREADEREHFLRQQQEGQRRDKERKEGERTKSKSSRARGQSVSEQSEKKQSSAWGPVAGATAAATVGAVIASRDSRDGKARREPQTVSRQQDQTYQAKEVTPHSSRDGEPLMDDEIFDPDFFKRKHTPAESARHEELARKAADKVVSADNFVSDRERAYEDHSTYAEFFAPTDILSEPAEGKPKVQGPNADNDIQVYHARDANILAHLDGTRYGGTYGQSKHAPFGVPKLNLISPTPPITESSPVQTRASPSSPLANSSQLPDGDTPDVETDSDGKSERLNRSISWGEDKTHIYDVQTPESYNEKERDSYITSPDVTAAARDAGSSNDKSREIVVEEASSTGQLRKTTYNEDELAKHYRESSKRENDKGTTFTPQLPFYRQPSVDSVSDFSVQLPTGGAPPVRGYVEGEKNQATPLEEKATRVPGGFDDDTEYTSTSRKQSSSSTHKEDEHTSAGASREMDSINEPVWEAPLSKKDKKKREKASKEVEPEPIVDEPAWEPPLSKKEQKKRDKAAKRSSTVDSEPSTSTAAESDAFNSRDVLTDPPTPIQSVEEPAWEPPLSKKEQKKRDKAKKQGFADIVDSVDSSPRDVKDPEPTEENRTREASPSTGEEPALTKKEQKKQDKQAKKSGFGAFADVADTILASGGIAAAAGALDSNDDDGFSSAGKKKGKKGKKTKLGEPLDREVKEIESESPANGQSTMPGGWDADPESPVPKDAAPFDPFQYQVHDDDADAPPTAPEPPSSQEADPWAEFAEPKKSKKKSKRNSSAFNVPEVSSPLRTELAWDDYIGGDKDKATADAPNVEENASYTNGHGRDKDSETSRSERTPGESISATSDRRGSDYFGDSRQEASASTRRMSRDDSRSVASAPTPTRRDESRRGSDYFDEPSYAYETQSVAASEPVDVHGSSKKSKRRSRHEDDEPRRSRRDDDDDTRSVTSSRSRRDKEESPSVKKDKKSGILGSLFGRKSESVRDAPRDGKSSRDDEDEDARRRRKKKNREADLIDEDDDTRSVVSESRHRSHRSRSEYGGEDDDTRSMKSESRHKSHRSDTGKEDSRERRRRSTHGSDYERDASDGGKKHHRRRKSGEDSRSSSRHESRSESGHRHQRKTDEDNKDQSFLGMRVEDLPPLPADIPAMSSPTAIVKSDQGVGIPDQAGREAGMVKNVHVDGELDQSRDESLSRETPFASTESLTPRPGSSHRAASSTAIPLRFPFGQAPLTPTMGQTKERSTSFSSPVAPSTVSTPSSPVFARKSRQERPRSTEIKPLYLVERNRKTPEVEDALPSLPSSGPSSRASSVHLSDAYESAVEELESPGADRDKKLRIDIDGAQQWREEHGDVLGSKETTPKASEAPQRPFLPIVAERQVKQEPQFYTWEDFAREERGREVDDNLPPLPRSRSESPLKADQHIVRDGVKVAAAASILGTAAVYAAGKMREQRPVDRDASSPADADVLEAGSKSEAPLSRKSSMKKKGKKSKRLQWQDEETADSARDASSIDKGEAIGADVIPHQTERGTVFASAAAHSMPALNYRADSQQQPDDVTRSIEHEDDRPSTSYKIPTAKAEPAPLIVEQRIVAADKIDATLSTSEIKQVPQLTRKQSKKSEQQRQSVPLFEHEQAPVATPSSDAQHIETQDALPQATPFGLSDFSNFARESAAGWHDSQAGAFQTAMSESASRPRRAPKDHSSRDMNIEQVETDIVADAPTDLSTVVDVDRDDAFVPASNAKQSKRDKKSRKQKASLWSEEPEEVNAGLTDTPEPEREIVDELSPSVEDAISSSSKKSKKDKKKKSAAWDEPETREGPSPVAQESTVQEAAGEKAVVEEPHFPVLSSKKSKKDRKRQSLAWDETEVQQDPHPSADQPEATTEQPMPEAETTATPASEEPVTASSKKKSKKDKKKNAFAWDEPEVLHGAESLPESDHEVSNAGEDQAVALADEPSSIDIPQLHSAEGADTFQAVPKKGKKGKKSRQSVTWSDIVPEKPAPDEDNDAPFVDAEPEHQLYKSPTNEQTQESSHAIRDVAATAGPIALAATVAGLAQSSESVPATDVEYFAPVSSKKNKKQKKHEEGMDWTEAEAKVAPSLEPQDEFVDAEESAGVNNEVQAASAVRDGDLKSTPVVEESSEQLTSASREVGSEDTKLDEPTFTVSRKQSKKDKKKNRKSQTWDAEPEQASSASIEEASIGKVEDFIDVPGTSNLGQDTSASTAPSADLETSTFIPRKQSKKDKKRSREASYWEPEQNIDAQDSPAKSAETVGSVHNEHSPTNLQGIVEDVAANFPLPLADEDEFTDPELLQSQPEDVPVLPEGEPAARAEAQTKESTPPANILEGADVQSAPLSDSPMTDAARSPAEPINIQDGTDQNSMPETDDFFGPSDPIMEEPSRMTEDLDAFGEPDDRAMAREKKRAAREAAEAAKLAESMRERPKDENYASMLTDRKPVTKKGGKKGRKSISSVTPMAIVSTEQALTDDRSPETALRESEEIPTQDETLLPLEMSSADASEPLSEARDEDPSTSSSKKKSRKDRKDRDSISEPPASIDEVMPAVEASMIEDPLSMPTIDVSASEEVGAPAQSADVPTNEDDWAVRGKKEKKSKKGKKNRNSTTEDNAADEQSFAGEAATLTFPDVEAGNTLEESTTRDQLDAVNEPQVAPAIEVEAEESGWASGSKKKGKKGRKGRASIDAAPSLDDPQANDNAAIPSVDETNREKGLAAVPGLDGANISSPMVEPEADFTWTSTSNKKGKKGKKDRNSTSEIPPIEVDEAAESLSPEAVAPAAPESNELPTSTSAGSDPASNAIETSLADEESAWAMPSSKKKGKKGKKSLSDNILDATLAPAMLETDADTRSTSAVPADDADNHEPNPATNARDETIQPTRLEEDGGLRGVENGAATQAVVQEATAGDVLQDGVSPATEGFGDTNPGKETTQASEDAVTTQDVNPGNIALPVETKTETSPPDDSAWFAPQTSKKKGKKGKKSQQIEVDSEELNLASVEQSEAVNPESTTPSSQQPIQTDDVDVWALPGKDKKGKKGKKGKQAVVEDSVPAPVPEATKPDNAEVEREIIGQETSDTALLAPQATTLAAADDMWTAPVKGKKAKKSKKNKQSWDDAEPAEETRQAELSDATEVPLPDQSSLEHETLSNTAQEAWEENEPSVSEQNTRENAALTATEDGVDEANIDSQLASSLQLGDNGNADPNVENVDIADVGTEQATDSGSFVLQTSKKDKKRKGKKSGSSGPNPWAETETAKPVGDAPEDSEPSTDIQGRSLDVAAAAAAVSGIAAGAMVADASKPEVDEEWGSFSTKKSEKDKKKEKRNASPTPTHAQDDGGDQKVELTPETSQPSFDQAIGVDEAQRNDLSEAQPEAAVESTETENVEDGEWPSFSTKQSKKDKKKAKQSGNSTPAAEADDNVSKSIEHVPRDVSNDSQGPPEQIVQEEIAPADALPAEDDAWASFSTKKSKKDKKKAKQSGSSTPAMTAEIQNVEPAEAVPAEAVEDLSEHPERDTKAEGAPIEEDEWASFSTKKSKKDKKKSKMSTPEVITDDKDIGSVEAMPVHDPEPVVQAESARANTEPVEDDWASFSTKSKKDKKKAKQSDPSAPTISVDDQALEPVETAPGNDPGLAENADEGFAQNAPADTEHADAEPAEDEWANLSVKKSKKNKKNAKISDPLTPAVAGRDEAPTQTTPFAQHVAAEDGQEEAVEMTPDDRESASLPLREEMEADDWASSSFTKKSKKDKKKAKKSGVSTPAMELDNEAPSTTHEPPAVLLAESSAQSFEAEPSAGISTADNHTLGDQNKQPQSLQDTSVTPSALATDSAQDIDFAATLAAGLADSGFNPDMVINDPVFHRRASPPGVLPEADPEETFSTTTSKRNKGKKSQPRGTEGTPSEFPSASTSAAEDGKGQPPINDFNDTISQSLQGTGFDPSLLEKAFAARNDTSIENVVENEPEYSFTTSKRKKDKKGKKASLGPEEPAVMKHSTEEPEPSSNERLTPDTRDITDEPTGDPTHERRPEALTPPVEAQDGSTRDLEDPASRLAIGGDGEMDVDEMDKAYKAYKKNKRKQRKLKSSTKADGSSDNPESAVDTEKSAAASDNEIRSRSMAADTSSASGLGMAAAGVAVLAAGSLAMGDGYQKPASSARAPTSNEPEWSFASLDNTNPGASEDKKEREPIRDSGYEEANQSLQQSARSSREVPAIVRTSSSRESLRNRRSLEPLHISTGSTPEEEWKTPDRRAETTSDNALHAHARAPSADTPLLPTSKIRTSHLFQSPPDILAAPAGSSIQHENYDPKTPVSNSEASDYFKARGGLENRSPQDAFVSGDAATHGRSSFSPANAGGPLSPRTPLRSIAEETHASKRSKAENDVGGSGQIKVSKRSETPQGIQGIRARHRTLSPEMGVPGAITTGSGRATSNPLSTDDIIKRLSWPAVDEENDTVNIDRSVSRKAIMPDMRSPSVVSNRSATSGTYGRSAQELRSFSRNSNVSNQSSTPSLRRINLSGDLRAASRRGETGSSVSGSAPNTIPFEAPPTPPLNDDELNLGSASRAADMSDVFVGLPCDDCDKIYRANNAQQGYGDAAESHVSPTRPPSVRKRQSMHINELESRLDSLVAENRALQEARQSQDSSQYVVNDTNLVETLQQRELDLQAKDAEINQIKAMLQPMQEEIARLVEMNSGLTEANKNLVDDTNGRYATLQAEHAQAHEQWQSTSRNLENMQQEHGRITSGMKDILEAEIATALADKNAEILRLREQLDIATEQIRSLQVQIQSSNSSDFLIQRDEDYFDGSCQKLCQHVQQWVLRFSKLSDNRVCRLSTELNDDKLEARLDNAVLDGSDVDKLLGDRIRRRDVFMSVVMTMVWEYIFTRYLFGMDREQRQKLKALEKLLSDVGPPRAVAHWRATTLTLLSKRPNFSNQCAMDTEAVAIEIFGVLSSLLPPPSASEQQLLTSLQKVIRIAVDLAIEMRIQRAEYIMLPPLQPEYDTNGDLVRKVHFNASLMNERSGFFSSNEELAAEHAVVKIVLFPLVVKKGDDIGEGEEEIVVCPAQVLVRNDAGKGKKVVRVMSGAMEIDDPIRSRSRLSSKPSMMSEGGAF